MSCVSARGQTPPQFWKSILIFIEKVEFPDSIQTIIAGNTIKEPETITLPVLSHDQFQLALLLSDLTPKIVYFSFVLFFELVNLIFLFPQPVEEIIKTEKKALRK